LTELEKELNAVKESKLYNPVLTNFLEVLVKKVQELDKAGLGVIGRKKEFQEDPPGD